MSRNVGRVLASSQRASAPCRPSTGEHCVAVRPPLGALNMLPGPRALFHIRSLSTAQAQIQRTTSPAQMSGRRAVSSNGPSLTRQDSVTAPEEHLNSLFAPLQFPPELADRMLTHASHSSAKVRHNARLSFMGAFASCIPLALMLTAPQADE